MHVSMVYFLFLTFPLLIYAQTTVESDTSVIKTTWFWPLISLLIGIALCVPIAIILIIIFCSGKKALDDSDESSISSSSSSPPTSVLSHVRRNRSRHPLSHYVEGYPTPPPPYASDESTFVASSRPPPYESVSTNVDPTTTTTTTTATTATVIDVEPTESINYESTSTDISLSPESSISSIQTFPV
ncbi:unnamed protein product [Rotaria magnacalcarata]|uniref:Uncharacterized protein n=1 Tax=Rotaria magnacalcarata TaxID=392030 RepID=A0A816VQH6_9BILA|nr:unnamed protein product [Rotaria magnacalcarata]CAF4068939.1 unnamed protein product [Rotaria magnacalcarata]